MAKNIKSNIYDKSAIYTLIEMEEKNEIYKYMQEYLDRFDDAQLAYIIKTIIERNKISLMNMMIYDFNFDVTYSNDIVVVWCSSTNNIEMMQLLINHGADIHTRKYSKNVIYTIRRDMNWIDANEFIDDDYAFYNAIVNSKYHMVKFLLDAGVDPNACDGRAFLRGLMTYEITKLLIDYGADVTIQNNEALRRIVYDKNYFIIKLLIDNGADPNVINKMGTDPDEDILITYLIENGVDPIALLKIWK